MIHVTDDELLVALRAYEACGGNKAVAARELGIPRTTLTHRLGIAARRNLDGHAYGGPLPRGYLLGKVTTLKGPEGTLLEWQHQLPDDTRIADTLDSIREALADLPSVDPKPVTQQQRPHLAAIYPLADLHLNLLASRMETGETWDLATAEDAFKRVCRELVLHTPTAATAVILNLGDWLHNDTNRNMTEQHGNFLDTAARWQDAFRLGVELMAWLVDRAVEHHERVLVVCLRGNHDPYSAFALSVALAQRYRNEPRVEVEQSSSPFWFFSHGKCFIGATHGDQVTAERMGGVMAAMRPQEWGSSLYRYAYLGHTHKRKKGPTVDEQFGVTYESFQTIAAKDAWSYGMGHTGGRSMCSITLDADSGEKYRHTVSL